MNQFFKKRYKEIAVEKLKVVCLNISTTLYLCDVLIQTQNVIEESAASKSNELDFLEKIERGPQF